MICNRQSRLRAVLFAAIVAVGAGLCAQATIYRDCFDVEFYGDIRHVACTIDGLTDIHYAVDKFKTNDWEVVCHGGGNESRLVKAQPGEHILADNVFTNNSPTITGAAYPFVFAMMRTLGWKDYAGLYEVRFIEIQPPYAEDPELRSAIYASAHLGISPAVVDDEGSEHSTVAYYKMPSVEFVGIDPASRTITGRVVPAEGTHIVSAPLDRAFGFHRIYRDEDGTMLDGLDWGREMNNGYPGFELDTSCYFKSNGLFRITFPEDVLLEKHPQPAHLFRINLSDKAGGLW